MSFKYIVPFPIFDRWLNGFASAPASALCVPYESYVPFIRRLLEPVPVDEDWYCAAYPGVGQSIARGVFRSAAHHFLAHGYFEGRLPFAADRADLRQPIPFAELRALTPVRPARDGLRVEMERDALMAIVRRLLLAVPVDEAWYRRTYPGVDRAIARGGFASAAAHYAEFGYAECRWPFDMVVDEAWYRARYPDVPPLIADGTVADAQGHFWRFGYREGRFPAGEPAL